MNKNNQVKLEQLKLLYDSLLYSQIGMFLAGIIFIYILKTVIAKELLLLWISFLSLTVIYRLVIRQIFFFQLEQGNLNLKKANTRFLQGVFVSGLVWGSSTVFLYPHDSAVHEAYVVLIILGIVSSSVATLSPKKSAFSIFLLMTSTPLVIQVLLSNNHLNHSFAILIILFVIMSFISATRFNKNNIRSIQLRYEANKRSLELQRQENKYKFLFEKSEDPMLLISDFKPILANQAAVKLLGYQSLEHLLTADQFDLSPNIQADGTPSDVAAEQITQQLKDMGFHRSEWIYKRHDGIEKPAEITSTIVPFEGRKAVYCIIRDISKTKETEQELIVAKQKSEIANRSKSQFLANMSHEIRTPMNGVIGAINLLLQHELSKDQHYRAVTVKNSAEAMLSILNSILDFSKIEAGKLELDLIDFELNQFLHEFLIIISNRIESKGLNFIKPSGSLLPIWLKGDTGRIKQILINLMDNAIKFTDSGEISLSYNITDLKQDHIMLKFNISDTGIGINFEQQNLLFERFMQADSSTTRKYGGTGLGLSICKELTELMGGDIGFKSNKGRGCDFWFTIQLKKIANKVRAKGTDLTSKNSLQQYEGTILVVDDNQTNLEIAKGMLELLGLDIDSAENGLEALNLLEKHHYDLIFMDCQMPIMDGYQATKEIRKSQSNPKYKEIPVIAMTANAMQSDRQICLDSGMSDYLSKPIDLERIESLLVKWLACSSDRKTTKVRSFSDVKTNKEQINDQWFEYDALLERVSGNNQLIKKLALNFLLDLKLDIEQLVLHIKNQNISGLTAVSHKIKGASATFGCNRLSQLMSEIENSAKKNNDTNMEKYLEDIDNCFSKTIRKVEKTLISA